MISGRTEYDADLRAVIALHRSYRAVGGWKHAAGPDDADPAAWVSGSSVGHLLPPDPADDDVDRQETQQAQTENRREPADQRRHGKNRDREP